MERSLSANELAPICYSIKDAVRVSGLGRTKLYELMDSGVLVSVKIGAKRLIRCDSLEALLAAPAQSSQLEECMRCGQYAGGKCCKAVPAATPGLAPVNSGQTRTVTNVRKSKKTARASAYRT